MDYEKKLRLAKEALESGSYDRETIEYIFPELKESEDEKIRGKLLQWLKLKLSNPKVGFVYEEMKQWIAWLEKQGESSDKIHYWTEEEIEPIISDYLRGAEHYGGMIARLRCLKPKSLEKQVEQKPIDYNEELKEYRKNPLFFFDKYVQVKLKEQKTAWSEEDERNLKSIMKIIKEKAFADYDVDEDNNNMLGIYGILESWLKSLKDRVHPQWKPSEEQIQALEYQVNSTYKGSWQYKASKELLEQLKKL